MLLYFEQSPDENRASDPVRVSILLTHSAAQNHMKCKVNSGLFALLISSTKRLDTELNE